MIDTDHGFFSFERHEGTPNRSVANREATAGPAHSLALYRRFEGPLESRHQCDFGDGSASASPRPFWQKPGPSVSDAMDQSWYVVTVPDSTGVLRTGG